QVMRKFIRLPRADNTLSLVWNEKTMFLPGTIEQGNPTVIEQIEEVFESGIFLGFELDQQFGVVPWQDTERTGESHERDSHCGGIGLRFGSQHALNLACRKIHRQVRAKAGDLARRHSVQPDGRAVRVEAR